MIFKPLSYILQSNVRKPQKCLHLIINTDQLLSELTGMTIGFSALKK